MATYLQGPQIDRAAPPFAPVNDLGVFVVVRLAFYVGYYALNICFTAELFSVLLTLPVFIICCINIMRIKSRYATAQDMIWLVLYMFFVIEPCQSLRAGYFDNGGPVSGLYFEPSELVTADLIVILFLAVATITTFLAAALLPERPREISFKLSHKQLPLLVSISALAFLLFVFSLGGLGNVLADRYSRIEPEGVVPIAAAFLALQAVACLLALVCMKSRPKNAADEWVAGAAWCALSLVLLLVAQNPFNTARFMLLMAYAPIFLVLCSGRIGVLTFYVVAMIGLLLVMPILNFSGRFGMSFGEAIEQINVSDNVLRVPYIEVFDMLAYEVRYLQTTGLYFGAKTLGIVLFFIPRAIWTGKETLIAKDMGAELVGLKSAGTDNLSLFFAGEFYADLGLIGVMIGAVAVALLLTIFGVQRKVTVNGLDLRSYLVTAAAPIVIRGPIAAAIPLLFMQMVFLATFTRSLCQRIRPDRGRIASSPQRAAGRAT